MSTPKTKSHASSGAGLEHRVAAVGQRLKQSISAVLDALPGPPAGPVELARLLSVDKVLTSRVLSALRKDRALAVAHYLPGPDPLRRLLHAASSHGVPASSVDTALAAVHDFQKLIREEAGDRSSLDAVISSWLPEARQQFEIRRKQAAFKAMSQIKGACATTSLAMVALHPSADNHYIDLCWVIGSVGLQRIRPGASVKFTSRRISQDDRPRQPTTLDGNPVEGIDGLRLDAFCSKPPAPLKVHQSDGVVHYVLADDGFGPHSATNLFFAEVNLCEMARSTHIPGRCGYVFAEVNTPVKSMLFDVFVHEDLFGVRSPSLKVYDTVLDGVACANDPSRDLDRLDLDESIQVLGKNAADLNVPEIDRYNNLVSHVFDSLNWQRQSFRGYRCRSEYPIYGSQIVMAFDTPVVES